MRQNLELPTRPQFYQQFIRGFVVKKRCVLGGLGICRILPKNRLRAPCSQAVFANVAPQKRLFCLIVRRYSTRAVPRRMVLESANKWASRAIRTCVLLSHGRLVGAAVSSAYRGNLEVLNQIRQGMVTRSQAEEIHKVSVIRSSPALVNSACDLLRP